VPQSGFSELRYYTGTMQVLVSSGKACKDLKDRHAVEMVFNDSETKSSGYFSGEELTIGRFSGSNRARLEVNYPYQDEIKASGHFISIYTEGNRITAELKDRHIDQAVEDCNFDLARFTLNRIPDDQLAEKRRNWIHNQFEAQLFRSQAIALVKQGHNSEALPLYVKALALVDAVADQSPKILAPYLTSLANSYIRAGRYQDFNRLYDERFDRIVDPGVKAIFTGHRVRILMDQGKAALAREEYDQALANFKQAYRIHPQGKETIAAVMAAQVRAGNHDGATAFLEEALKTLENENDQKDVRAAIAMVLFQKSKKESRSEQSSLAEVSLRKAIAFDPEIVAYQVALARLRHKLGDLNEAESLLAEALEHFKDQSSRQELIAARERLRLTDRILAKIRRKN
jgi:tetratricopeptide (TPR) repeat protein